MYCDDKSQGSVAKHLSRDGLLPYNIVQFAGIFFKSANTFGVVSGKMVDRVI